MNRDKLKKEFVDLKDFAGTVNITDPCYDRNAQCRIDIDVKPGTYGCYVWCGEDFMFDFARVYAIGIYLNGKIPTKSSMKKIGYISVDSATAGFFMNKPDYTDDEWEQFCKDTDGDDEFWLWDIGFFSYSGDGDGTYPVYAVTNSKGQATALEIRF